MLYRYQHDEGFYLYIIMDKSLCRRLGKHHRWLSPKTRLDKEQDIVYAPFWLAGNAN